MCAELSEAEYTVLSNSSSKIMFFCTLCYTKVPFALKVEQDSVSHQSVIDKKLQSIEEKLENLEKSCITLNSDGCQPKITNIAQHPVKSSTDISTVLSSVLIEEKERSKRQLNLIVYNLEEASDDDAQARK